MAYIIGFLSAEEQTELERRGWEVEDAPRVDYDNNVTSASEAMKMVWVDQDMFKIMDGPDWDKALDQQALHRQYPEYFQMGCVDEKVEEE